MSKKTISEAVARARNARPALGLPYDTLERLFAVDRDELTPLPSLQWQILRGVLADLPIDASYIEGPPGEMLATEVEESDLGSEKDRDALAAACRAWSRTQALAVIDAYQQGLTDSLPKIEKGPRAEG